MQFYRTHPDDQKLEHIFTGLEKEKRYRVMVRGSSMDTDLDRSLIRTRSLRPDPWSRTVCGGKADDDSYTCTYLGRHWAQSTGEDIMVTR